MPTEVFFPENKCSIARTLQHSSYLKHLTYCPQDQLRKNGVKFCTTDELVQHYVSSCTPVPVVHRGYIRQAVIDLFTIFPLLPEQKVGFLLVRQGSNLEFSNAFTVNNVVFLTTDLLTKPELIRHEVIHVLQRHHTNSFFNPLYSALGYYKATQAQIQLIKKICFQSKLTFTDNPDESLASHYVYLDQNNHYILKNSTSHGKLRVDLNNLTVVDLPYSAKERILNISVSKDSVSEMFATLLSDSRKTVQNTLRCFMQGLFQK